MHCFYKMLNVLMLAFLVGAPTLWADTYTANPEDSRARAREAYGENKNGQKSLTAYNNNVSAKSKALVDYSNLPRPVFAVLPENVPSDMSLEDYLKDRPFLQAGTQSIHDYLSKKGYEVKSLTASTQVNEIVSFANEINGNDDISYAMSLMIGADIYVRFSGTLTSNLITCDVNAYETATGRLLGSQTGHMKNDKGDINWGSINKLYYYVQMAVKKAMPGLEKTIYAYWQEDLQKGVQYKLVISLANFQGDDAEDAADETLSILRKKFGSARVNALTEQTLDINLYANPNEYQDAFAVYSAVKSALKPLGKIKKKNLNNRLILVDFE